MKFSYAGISPPQTDKYKKNLKADKSALGMVFNQRIARFIRMT